MTDAVLSVKQPPPLEIEAAVIGALLFYPGAYEAVRERLAPEHFVEPFLGDVYEWIELQMQNGAVAGEVLQMACLNAASEIYMGKRTIAHCIAATCLPIELPYAVRLMIEYREGVAHGDP